LEVAKATVKKKKHAVWRCPFGAYRQAVFLLQCGKKTGFMLHL
jgi:hypothetical protein